MTSPCPKERLQKHSAQKNMKMGVLITRMMKLFMGVKKN
jgi:hypothetical protein